MGLGIVDTDGGLFSDYSRGIVGFLKQMSGVVGIGFLEELVIEELENLIRVTRVTGDSGRMNQEAVLGIAEHGLSRAFCDDGNRAGCHSVKGGETEAFSSGRQKEDIGRAVE